MRRSPAGSLCGTRTACPKGAGVPGRDGGRMQLTPARYKQQLLELAGFFLSFPLLSLQTTDGAF